MIDDIILNCVIAIFLFNFFYILTVGFLAYILYVALLFAVILEKIYKNRTEKTINQLVEFISWIGVLPSISLCFLLILPMIDWEFIIFVAPALAHIWEDQPYTLPLFFVDLSITLLWWMPAVFLLIKKRIKNSVYYHKFSIIWLGFIVLFLAYLHYYTFFVSSFRSSAIFN